MILTYHILSMKHLIALNMITLYATISEFY